MAYTKVKLEVADEVATITLNDPSTMNAAGIDLVEELADAAKKVAAGHEGARALIITGEGRGFCSGANLSGRLELAACRARRGPSPETGSRATTIPWSP